MTADAQTTLPIISSELLEPPKIISSGRLEPPKVQSSGFVGPLPISSSKPVTISSSDVQMSLPWASGKSDASKKILNEITTDSINVPPVKRCVKCVGCKNCKKAHLPDQARQLAQADIVRKSLSFNENGYKASYPYNKLLFQLEEKNRVEE